MKLQAYSNNGFVIGGRPARCALGKGGVVDAGAKTEGDGATPLGQYRLRRVLYRADRLETPVTRLPVRAIRPDDGWCDAPDDPAYNRPVRLPYPASAETLTREDALYDIIVILAHNDSPPVPGLGSAIFFHLEKQDYRPTLGCVAISRADMLEVLKGADAQTVLDILRA